MKTLLLLLLKGAKLKPALLTLGTMCLSIGVYATKYGWWFSTGFVLLILVHELGHFVAAKQKGLEVGAPVFIPFLGAWIALKDQHIDSSTEAYVAMAGPVAGTFGALLCYYVGDFTGNRLLIALAYSGFFLNLFNLIPISPLDGGRITQVVSKKLWLIGLPLLVLLYFYHSQSPMLLVIVILAFPHFFQALQKKPPSTDASIREVSTSDRISYGCYYLGLTIFLSLMTYGLHQRLGG